MKKLLLTISFLLLPVSLVCIDEHNPFTDLSNAKIVIESKSFINGENVPVFSAETLSVAPVVDDNIDSFTLQADDNRLWSDGDTTIHNNGSLDDEYTFYISFYDTGYKDIIVTTFRKDTLPYSEKFKVYAYSPLSQAPVSGYSSYTKGSLQLHMEPVEDPGVLYYWNFGNSYLIKSSQNVLDTNIIDPIPDTVGTIYITDRDGQFQSPVSYFSFSIFDTISPVILCVNSDSIVNDTIITGDSIFVFKAQIYDQDTVAIGVDSAAINGEVFDQFYEKNKVYSKFFFNIHQYKDTAKKVLVTATDNDYFNNSSGKTFWIRYDSTIEQTGNVEIYVNQVSDTTITANPTYTISGRVINTTGSTITLEIEVNDSVYDVKHTITSVDTTWFWTLSLNEGSNTAFIFARALSGTILNKKKVKIYHDPDIADPTGPVIWKIYADNQLYSGSPVYVDTSSVEIRTIAFDIHSKIDSLQINGSAALAQADGITYSAHITPQHPPENTAVEITAKDIHSNQTDTTISVIYNTLPRVKRDSLRNPVLPIGTTYQDTIYTSDAEMDFTHIAFITQGSWQVSGKVISFTPDSSHIGNDSITFQVYDGFQYTPVHTWYYEVIDTVPVDSVKFSPDLKNQLPTWMIAGEDSLSLKLNVIIGTPPFHYTAAIANLDTVILDSATTDTFSWAPDLNDTGTHILKCMVTDSANTKDLFIHTFTVLPPNSDTVKLDYIVKPDSIWNGDTIDLRDSVTAQVTFTVTDNDNPLTETHTVTITSADGISTFTLDSLNDSLQFNLTIGPELNKDDEQILVEVVDSDNHTAQKILNVLYPKYYTPDEIDSLLMWFDADDSPTVLDNTGQECGDGDTVETWKNKAPGGTDVIKGGAGPNYNKNSPPKSIQFFGNVNTYLLNNLGTWTNNYFSIYIIAQSGSIENNKSYPLISSSSSIRSFNIGVTNSSVGVFERLPDSAIYSQKLTVTNNTKYLFGFKSQPLRDSKMIVSLNGRLDTMIIHKTVHDDFVIGANTSSSEGWEGTINEIIYFTGNITKKEEQGLFEYIKKKYEMEFKK